MIKFKLKYDNTKEKIGVSYNSKKANTLEHIYAIALLWQEITLNADMSDKEIHSCVKDYLEDLREKEEK